jgi:hypothetical protein
MDITRSSFTVSEIRDMWDRQELIVNRSYQRSASVWPDAARTYLIDTILNGYVVPKVYLYQVYDKKRKKVIREIVDGQQRLTTILDYIKGEFNLNSRSPAYAGLSFDDLEDDEQQKVLTYNVEVDVIQAAETSDLLAMFTRMNAYTAPLNPAEKRHAQFEGAFKWFILELSAVIGPKLVNFGVLTSKQSVRMQDSEFLTELAIVLDKGIENKSEASLMGMYKKYDKQFDQEDDFTEKLFEFIKVLEQDFLPLKPTLLAKSYVIHSLFCAMMQKKYGIPGGKELGVKKVGYFYKDLKKTIANLRALTSAHELQDEQGEFGEYVTACLSTTHRTKQRQTRTRYLAAALV